jgi:hypothetical protein
MNENLGVYWRQMHATEDRVTILSAIALQYLALAASDAESE